MLIPDKLKDVYPLVRVDWVDIIRNDSPWITVQKAVEWADDGPGRCMSVGLLIKKTRKYVLIAGGMDAKTSKEHDLGGIECIPAGCIEKITVIRQLKR